MRAALPTAGGSARRRPGTALCLRDGRSWRRPSARKTRARLRHAREGYSPSLSPRYPVNRVVPIGTRAWPPLLRTSSWKLSKPSPSARKDVGLAVLKLPPPRVGFEGIPGLAERPLLPLRAFLMLCSRLLHRREHDDQSRSGRTLPAERMTWRRASPARLVVARPRP